MKMKPSLSAGIGRGIVSRLFLPLMVLTLGSPLVMRAQDIISVKFTSPKNSNQNFMYAGDYAGAPGVRTNNWNNMVATADGNSAQITLTAGAVVDSGGVVIPNLQITGHPSTSAGGGGVYNRTAGGTNDGKMFGDVSDTYQCNGFGNYGYIDFTNIPFTNYNIYCYFRPDSGNGSGNTRGGFFCVTNMPGVTNRCYIANQTNDGSYVQMPDPSTSGGNYFQSQTASIASGGAAWTTVQGGNYVVFNNLTNSWMRVWFGGLGNSSTGNANGASDDLGNYVLGGSPAVRFKVAAFQIVQVNGGLATNLFFSPSNTTLHAGNPAGTQSTLDSQLASGSTVNVSASATYTSDNTNVATVSASGLITAGTNGTAHIVASYQSLLATDTVTVVGPTSLYINVANTNLLVGNGMGDTTKATLYANFSDAANVPVNTYGFVSFSGSANINIRSNGTLTVAAAGPVSVTGNYDGLSTTTNGAGYVNTWSNILSVPGMSVHFTGSSVSMTFHDVAGATGVRGGYWNNFVQNTGNVTNELDNPTDDQGNALAGTVVQFIPDFGGVLANQSLDLLGYTTNESVLFGDCYDLGMNNGTTVASEMIISNVPYASYDLYFYVWNDTANTNRPAEFIIDGNTQYRNNSAAYASQPGNTGTGYVVAAPQPGSLPASVANVPFGNVVKFTGLTDSNLVVQIAAVGQDLIGDANGVTRVRLAGFQIMSSLSGYTATNIYLSPLNVPAQLPGNPTTYGLTLLADFSNGPKAGNITSLPGVTYSSSNTNIFEVDTNGNITAGLTPGTATLSITYQAEILNTTVTNLAPTAVTVTALPNTVYLNGVLGVQPAQAEALATFPGNPNVNIGGFATVSFVDQGSAAATMSSSGTITANTTGQANLGVSYLGTTYVTANAFTVLNTGGAPTLAHQYNFHDASNSTTVVDSIGGANGTVFASLGTNQAIKLDGSRAIFPGDGTYLTEPYIALPGGVINAMGDVTIEIWCGQSQRNTWSRFFGFGNTPKGTNPHVYGGTATTSLQLLASYAGTGLAADATPGSGDLFSPSALANGTEYQMVIVCAPNAGVAAFYINGVLVTNGTASTAFLNSAVNDVDDWLGVSLSNDDAPLAGWINNLAIYEGVMTASQVALDYTNGLAVYTAPVSGPATNVVPVAASVSAGNLNLSWPADHLGWHLQVQTNALSAGLGTNWQTVSGSSSVTNMSLPINPANGSVFYRLTYP